ncbi:MAG: hypothetical protein Q4B15_04090 [Lachnospiraceae bacterium]|nr:hypothetical protein [Lachnospiraceae bacterium]
MAKTKRYTFIKPALSADGIASVVMAILSGLMMAADILISFRDSGNSGAWIGGIAVTAILIAIYGFHLGITSFREKNVTTGPSIIGSILCGLLAIGWLTMFFLGLG